MKNLKIKVLAFAQASAIFLLTGCSLTTDSTKDYTNTTTSSITANSSMLENGENIDNTSSITNNTSETDSTVEQENDTSNEFNYFESEKQEVINLIDENKLDQLKERGKELFTTAVDFLFYGDEYKGYTFDELTDKAKEITFDNIKIIDGLIMSVIPNYKESLEEKYNIVKDFTSESYQNVLNYIRETIGDDAYNAITDTKNEVKDTVTSFAEETGDKIKVNVKSWYENLKEN